MNKDNLLAVIIGGSILFIGLFILLLCLAPMFTGCILGILATMILFFMSEKWYTHDAFEFENRFWTALAFIFAFTCVFCPDSPIRFSSEHIGIGWAIIIIFSYLAHLYDRMLRSYVLEQIPKFKRAQSLDFGVEKRTSAKNKQYELQRLISLIDSKWMSSTIQNIFILPKVLYIENQIINIFTEATDDELNIILPNLAVGRFFYKIKDFWFSRHYNRTKLLRLLCVDRIRGLSVPSKAILIDGLQRMKLSAHPQSEQFLKSIIKSTQTDDLSELKSMTDAKGDIYSMHNLLYSEITGVRSSSIRKEILDYFKAQANIQKAHTLMKGRHIGGRRRKYAWMKILSDIDDTLLCSGGHHPHGVDTSYPRKAIYPGVLAFYRELDLGTSSDLDHWDNTKLTGNLTFLSARPHVYKEVAESAVYGKVRDLIDKRGLYSKASLLAGSLESGSKFMLSGDLEPIALKKFENFKEYLSLYPEYSCIFIGDNGQGDLRAAELVLSSNEYKDNLQRVYIHKAIPIEKTHVLNEDYKKYNHPFVYFFDTYIDAAIDAHKKNLIKITGLRRIMLEAYNDFAYIHLDDWNAMKHVKVSANSGASSNSTTITSSIATGSSTSGGGGGGGGGVLDNPNVSKLRREGSSNSKLDVNVYGNNINDIRESRLRELDAAICRGNKVLKEHSVQSVHISDTNCRYNQIYKDGSVVLTLYGQAVVKSFRDEIGMYEVDLSISGSSISRSATAYLQGNALFPLHSKKRSITALASSHPPPVTTGSTGNNTIAIISANIVTTKVLTSGNNKPVAAEQEEQEMRYEIIDAIVDITSDVSDMHNANS